MLHEKKETILNYVKKSKETLKDAQIAFSNNRYENSLNRIYYAVFNIITALAYLDGFITSKRQTLMGWFNKKYIYGEKIFPEDLYSTYKEAFENRQSADYSILISFSKEDVNKSIKNVEKFIPQIEKYILDNIEKV